MCDCKFSEEKFRREPKVPHYIVGCSHRGFRSFQIRPRFGCPCGFVVRDDLTSRSLREVFSDRFTFLQEV